MIEGFPPAPARIRLHEPRVAGNSVHFSWEVEGDEGLYRRPNFRLEFPEPLDVAAVPEGLWLRVMLICLHSQWTLLRPCRVEIPRSLPPEEREVWLRLIDAAVWTYEADNAVPGTGDHTQRSRRSVEIVDFGPPAGKLEPSTDRGRTVSSFSGGRDSLTQTAILRELGLDPILVTTISSREGSIEFETDRFYESLAETGRRTGAEMLTVSSDLRSCWDNFHPRAARYSVAVSETADTLLYLAVIVAVAWMRGARLCLLASEAEGQESVRVGGGIVQIEHHSYSMATQTALSRLLAPTGIECTSTTAPLEHFQIHRLLAHRYSELRDLQYSCYQQTSAEQPVCNACFTCFKASLYLISEGVSPSEIGSDGARVVVSRSNWRPYEAAGAHATGTAARVYARRMDDQLVRVLRRIDLDEFARLTDGEHLSPKSRESFEGLRAAAIAAPDPPPEPGYWSEYIDLMPEAIRPGIGSIFSEHFEPRVEPEGEDLVANTKLLLSWLTEPLEAAAPKERPHLSV